MTHMRNSLVTLFAVALLAGGCGRPEHAVKSSAAREPAPTPPAPPPPPAPPGDVIGRIRWVGQDAIATDTNGAYLKRFWDLPTSVQLKAQTLDKSALGPWHLLHRDVDTNAGALFRPLVEDLLHRESWVEMRQVTNQPGELVFAIRLDEARAARWETNLAAVMKSLTGIQPVPAPGNQQGWVLKKHHPPNLLEFSRVGSWAVFGAAQDRNALLADVRDRLQRGQTPLRGQRTNAWLEAELELPRIATAFALNWTLPADFPGISVAILGDGRSVLTRGRLDFPRPLSLELPPWSFPTNMIDAGLSGFSCARGFKSWLTSQKAWNDLQLGPPPDQWCCWALTYLVMQTYFAAPLPDASNQVSRLTDFVLEHNQALFGENDAAGFRKSEATGGLEWDGIPYLFPFLQSLESTNGTFAFGGMFPLPEPEEVLTPDKFPQALSRTNLVYHGWELTGTRTEQWAFMAQFIRFAFGRPQVPEKSVSLECIRKLEPMLGPSVTDVTLTAPNQLAFERQSTIGLTGIELNLLADWLESPQFPVGLHTFLAPPPNASRPAELAPAPPAGTN